MCGCGVEGTPRWLGPSGQHGTESETSGDLEHVRNVAVLSRGRAPDILCWISTYWMAHEHSEY